MRMHRLLASWVVISAVASAAPTYSWRTEPVSKGNSLSERIAPPPKFERVAVDGGSFGEWLRGLPLEPEGAPVLLFNGDAKARQDVHVAVVDIDVGNRDLQQCADAVMRFRAEWLFSSGHALDVAFNDTAGKRLRFSDARTHDYAAFRKYLTNVFVYAGTASLERELEPVKLADISIGDVLIKGGFPGHAMLVVDVVENRLTHERRFLLVQSYMPAQQPHVVKNPNAPDGSPWFSANEADQVVTPEWSFRASALRRWRP